MKILKLTSTVIALALSANVSAAIVNIEPDGFAAGTNIETVFSGVTLSVEGRPDAEVLAVDSYYVFNPGAIYERHMATTGTLVFGYTPVGSPISSGQVWDEDTYGMLRADFDVATDFVSIDLIFDDDDTGVLYAFDSVGNLLDTFMASGDGRGVTPFVTASISRSSADISYILAGGLNAEALFLDNLQVNAVPVPGAVWLFGSGLIGLIGVARRKRS